MTPHALYRFLDTGGHLLYVGITLNPAARFRRHQRRNWWTDVATITIETYPDRASVLAAEALAIGSERPTHNVQHQLRPASLHNRPRCCQKLDPELGCPATWTGGQCSRGPHHHCLGQPGTLRQRGCRMR